jgi:hypothetical protein
MLSSSPGNSGQTIAFQEKTMRRLQQLSIAAVLTLTLATGALAGIMESPPAPQALPATATGTIETPPSDRQDSAVPSESVAEVALNLLQSALSMF